MIFLGFSLQQLIFSHLYTAKRGFQSHPRSRDFVKPLISRSRVQLLRRRSIMSIVQPSHCQLTILLLTFMLLTLNIHYRKLAISIFFKAQAVILNTVFLFLLWRKAFNMARTGSSLQVISLEVNYKKNSPFFYYKKTYFILKNYFNFW